MALPRLDGQRQLFEPGAQLGDALPGGRADAQHLGVLQHGAAHELLDLVLGHVDERLVDDVGLGQDHQPAAHPEQVRGVKLSLLDADLERRLRDELAPRGQVVLTGDDFHFGALIEGDDLHPTGAFELGGERFPVGRFSHALLGVLDGVAAPAALALRLLAHGDVAGYRAVIEPCEAFGRAVFEAPTSEYKTGLAFVAWLNHHQPEFL
ncbi:MAG: DUF993 family protein, partial [Planctomycetes bacterium]|nr:DUF993 family protein [Planctomycetota bacterium]